MEQTTVFKYGEDKLTPGIGLDICRGHLKGILTKTTIHKINASEKNVEKIIQNKEIVYGINTGFGPLCTTLISQKNTQELQKNLLLSHSVGVGNFLDKEISKLMMILKVHSLSKGFSGIRLETLQRIIFFIDNDIIPCVPEQGSVGASGDLAPLSHLFLPLIGFGEVFYENKIKPIQDIFQNFNIKPITLGPKEGLALINGTQFIAAHGIKIVEKLQNCLDSADIIAAMLLEALAGSEKPFFEQLHNLRPYKGSVYVSKRIQRLLKNSEIMQSHVNCGRVQDPYSIRCIPQVHGASRDAWLHLKNTMNIELNSVTDNPIILKDTVINGGNFHGQPLALPIDYAGLAAAELGNISDRRIYLAMDGKVEGVPKLLMKDTGLNSGFMILQYTTAALVSENKSYCFPASADSIPTSLGQEDHVSMGAHGARKTLRIIKNLEKILGIELMCAVQALDFRRPLKSSLLIETCHQYFRKYIPHANSDRFFYTEIKKAIDIIRKKELITLLNEIKDSKSEDLKNEKHEIFGIY